MKFKKQPLDERQEREMYSVYKWGFWVLFWGIFVQLMISNITGAGGPFVSLGNFAIMIAGGAVVTVGSAKRGIWCEFFRPSVKNNVIVSLIAGIIVFLIGLLIPFTRGYANELSSVDFAIAGVIAVFTATITLILLCILMRATNKRKSKLEADYED